MCIYFSNYTLFSTGEKELELRHKTGNQGANVTDEKAGWWDALALKGENNEIRARRDS